MIKVKKIAFSICAAPLSMVFGLAVADTYPSHPITWVVPYSAGGPTDLAARALAARLSETFDQKIVVENRPGAATAVGIQSVLRAPPDGYTLVSVDNAAVFIKGLQKQAPFDALKDLKPVARYGTIPFILVVNDKVPTKNVAELLELARKNPGTLTFASPGVGSPHHIYMELFKARTNVDINHVPYKGGSAYMPDLASGRISMSTTNWGLVGPYIQKGDMRPLAVTTSHRISALPQVPTLQEAGVKDFEAFAWQGVAAPAGTPDAVVAKLADAISEALRTPEIRASFSQLGIDVSPMGPVEFREFMKSESEKWVPLIQERAIGTN